MCLTVDGLPSSPVVVGDTCEPVHDVVEGAALVAESLLTYADGTVVFSSLGHHVGTLLDQNPTQVGAINFDDEVNSGLCYFSRVSWIIQISVS